MNPWRNSCNRSTANSRPPKDLGSVLVKGPNAKTGCPVSKALTGTTINLDASLM